MTRIDARIALCRASLASLAGCERSPVGEGFFRAEVRGVVSDAGGAPVAGVRVVAFGPEPCGSPRWMLRADSATTGADGRYAVQVMTFGGGSRCLDACANLQVVAGTAQPDTTTVRDVPVRLCMGGGRETVRDIVLPAARLGARGGHGPVRYHVESYEPGARVVFRLPAPRGFHGAHAFRLDSDSAGRTVLRHELVLDATGCALLTWPL
jgi:hypothetical protein